MEATALEALDRLHRLPDSAPLTTREAALFLRSSVSALEAMRRQGVGPVYIQAGLNGSTGSNQKCLYQKGDLLAWLMLNKVTSSIQAPFRKRQL